MKSDFSFLKNKWPELSELVIIAEENVYTDPNTTMIKLRMFTEQIVDYIFAYDRLEEPEENNLYNKLRLLEREELIEGNITEILHALRIEGNRAVHESFDSFKEAKTLLSLCYKLSVWFMQVYGEWDFEADEYTLPEKDTSKDIYEIEKKYDSIINELQKEIAEINANQKSLEDKNKRVEKSKKYSDQVIFSGPENEILKVTEYDKDKFSSIDSSYKFITTDIIDFDNNKIYKNVWNSIKRAFSGRNCIAYWKYPLFSKKGEERIEPEIIVVDCELGVIVLKIREEVINDIKKADYDNWLFSDGFKEAPLLNVEDQLFALKGLYQENRSLRFIYERTAVILPNIDKKNWLENSFDEKNLIFADQMGSTTLLNRLSDIETISGSRGLNDEAWKDILMALTGQVTFKIEGEDEKPEKKGLGGLLDRFKNDNKSRSEVKQTIKKDLFEVDMQQEIIGKTIPPGPQRIRGIAGSGKTVLLAQKAAHMHLKHPDWKIALIFFTRSLYDNVIQEVNKWLKRFSNGEVEYNPKGNPNLQVLHAWGAKDQPGFYREICEHHNVKPLHAMSKKLGKGAPNEKLVKACKFLLENADEIEEIYDAILIDEAQDLVVDGDELRFEDKQPFYWLAYQTLKPILKDNDKRIIWAYDEAQSLNSLNIPTAPQLFGDNKEFKRMVSGFHEGGIRKSEIMNKCYRTPGPVLTAAHAIGMGLLRQDGMLRGYTTQEDWENIGYKVLEGSFNPPGQKVVLHRPEEMTPNRVPELWDDDIIKFKKYNKRKNELKSVAESIKYNIEKDKLKATRDILVIVLGDPQESYKLKVEVAKAIKNVGIDIYMPKALKNNIFYPKYPNIDPNKFWNKGGITVTNTFKAKGNEAYMVYVIGLDVIAKAEDNFALRNQLFVALTRTKGWLKVSGVGDYPMYKEFEDVLASGNKFEFTFQRPKTVKIKKIKNKEKNQAKECKSINLNDVVELKSGKRAKVIAIVDNKLKVKISNNVLEKVKASECKFIRKGRQVY
ncbi:MAG: DUF4145 domain-containing protein [bacterium]